MIIRKTIISIATLVVTLTVFWIQNGFCADGAKIGVVDFQKIFENSAAGKAAKNKIHQEGQSMNADLDKIQKEIKALQDQIEKDGSAGVLSKSALEDKRWELNRKVEEVKALNKRFEYKMQQMQVHLINEVRKDVLSIIEAYGKKEGFLIIFEDINVVYATQAINITNKIVELYNAEHAKKGTKK
jgi:outer membrane protein